MLGNFLRQVMGSRTGEDLSLMLHNGEYAAKIQFASNKTLAPSADRTRGKKPVNILWIDRNQLLLGSSSQCRLFGRPGGRFRVKSIKNGRTNEDREKQGYDVHSGAEQKRLPAADRVEG